MITVIANLKGGSGKSTVAFNLAIWLKMQRVNVIAYDLDPQQTLNDLARLRKQDGTEPELEIKRLDDEFIVNEITTDISDVIVDVGAANMNAMKNAIKIADRVIVPVQPSQPDVWATQRFIKMVDNTCDNAHRPELMAFINRADTHHSVTESDEAEQALASLDGVKVIPYRLCQRTNYRRALSEGVSILELPGKSKSIDEFTKFAFALYPELNTKKV